MRYISLFIFCFYLVNPVFGQEQTVQFDPTRNYDINIRSYEQIEGTPFYNDDWIKGHVIFNSSQISETVELKYLNFRNQVVFKQNGETLAVNPKAFKGFVLKSSEGDILFKKGFKSNEHDIKRGQLLEVIHDGNIKLLTLHKNELDKSQPDPLTGKITQEFESEMYHFLVDRNGRWHEVDLDDDDILEALGDNQDAMEKFANKNDIDFENKRDLKMLLKHYESMMDMKQ